MSVYHNAKKVYWHNLESKYAISIKFTGLVSFEDLEKELHRKRLDVIRKGNYYHTTVIYKNVCKNFALEMKRLLLKDDQIKEVKIKEVK